MGRSYKPLDMQKINKRLKTLSTGKYHKLAEGKNKIRILPRLDDSGLYYLEVTLHHGFTDGEKRKRAYPCLQAMRDTPCPICEFYEALKNDGEDKISKKIEAGTQFLCNIVDRATGQIQIYSFNGKMFRGFNSYLNDEDYGPEVLDPENGYDFSIDRTGQGIATRYGDPRIGPRPKSIGIKKWESKIHDLLKEVDIKSYKELVEALEDNYGDFMNDLGLNFKKGKKKRRIEEEEDEEDESEEEDDEDASDVDDRSKAKRRRNNRKKKSHISEEEDDEGSDEEDSPRKKRKRKSRKPVEEDLDDDDDFEEDEDEDDFEIDDDDEEDIEEAPKPRKKSKKKKARK